MPVLLHVGCGRLRKAHTTRAFNRPEWSEIRLDIDPAVEPDVVASITDMSPIPDATIDAVFSSHNIEHLYPHEAGLALAEFRRVLTPGGFLIITCPDLQEVAALIAEGKLTEPAYVSPEGPIAPIDILYGHGAAMAAGNLHMAHRGGFTLASLSQALSAAGFANNIGLRRRGFFELWFVASRQAATREALADLAAAHFPPRQATPPA
jgi:SAM-dependent methyltransferase